MPDISEEVLNKAAGGDLKSFEQIYKATSGFVYNVAYRIVNSPEEAQEVTQEVFLTMYRKLNTFRFQSALKTWLYRITVNSAINHSRKVSRERHQRFEDDGAVTVDQIPGQQGSEMTPGEHESLVSYLLKGLNHEQRACLILRGMEGLSYQQIAEILRININTVRSRIKRARTAMLAARKEVVGDEM